MTFQTQKPRWRPRQAVERRYWRRQRCTWRECPTRLRTGGQGTAPTTSSTLTFSSSFMLAVQMTAPMAPMMIAQWCSTISGPAVIETSPAMAPFSPASRSIRPRIGLDTAMAAMTPAAPAKFVLTSTWLIATASAAVPSASCDPPLKPNQPNHRMKTPSVTTGMLDGGVGRTVPSLINLPRLGPMISAPASAAQPPVPCTMLDPAKSWNPSSFSQPPPHVQAPTTG